MFFVSGNSRILSEHLVVLLDLVCCADALYLDNLQAWFNDAEAMTLLGELIKQGSLESLDE